MTIRLAVLALAIFLISNTMPSLADEGEVQKQKTVFQLFADGLTGLGEEKSVAKEDATVLFQKSHDYIEKTFPDQKPKTLRGRPDEIARRRGVR